MTAICAIGLMSGTSMDGIDIAMLRTDGDNSIERGPSMFVPYEPTFRRRIEASLEVAKGSHTQVNGPAILPVWSAKSPDATLRRCWSF